MPSTSLVAQLESLRDLRWPRPKKQIMGAWDATSFGNDTAGDWVFELEKSNDLSYIDSALQKVLDAGGDYVEAPDGEEAIAAADVLAWLRGRPTPVNAYTEKVSAWVSAHPQPPPPAMVQKALAVLDRLQQSPSELLELWEGDPDWAASMAELRSRLSS